MRFKPNVKTKQSPTAAGRCVIPMIDQGIRLRRAQIQRGGGSTRARCVASQLFAMALKMIATTTKIIVWL